MMVGTVLRNARARIVPSALATYSLRIVASPQGRVDMSFLLRTTNS